MHMGHNKTKRTEIALKTSSNEAVGVGFSSSSERDTPK